MANWDRQYRLRAGVEGSKGFEIGEPDKTTNLAIHINFTIEKSDSTTLNTTKIKLWNLNKEQINILTQTGCQIDITAGYGASRPVVFRGTVSNVNESLDGADRLVEIEAVDGFAELSETVVSVSYSGKISAAKILKDAADKLNLPVSYSATAQEILERSYFSNGYSFVGYAQYVLDDACSKASLMWTIQNGVLQVRRSSEGISTALHKLNKDTGLINIPKRVYSTQTANTDSSIDTTSDMLYGYEIEYFMNGAIGIGDRVYVESSLVKGVYMVSKLQIEGDNIEGNWQCTAQITEVS